jgi:regulation of enolase protein 1 (concanavalin A-like superfamily)
VAHTNDWHGTWLNPPARVQTNGGQLVVTTRDSSDFWRTTAYGFVHDNGHALLAPLAVGEAVEVDFLADFTDLYDQAGVLVRVDEHTWIKAGLEFTDGALHLGAVVTHERSDWSMAPVPDWRGREVSIRISRDRDSVTVRARVEHGDWRMVRLAPLDGAASASAGPMCCSPTRAGMVVRFTGFRRTDADTRLHD